ncbi:MAG: Mad3/BUB1 homology region 1-domain-containing protein, partial [Piptocephalis tieghemiana]
MASPEKPEDHSDISVTPVAAIESQKENIIPLPQGRSASQLSHILQSPSSTRHAQLLQRHAHFQRLIDHHSADLDDPLEIHCRYVRWIQENYPQGQSAESNLLPVLERLTRSFKSDRRYKNDPRYIRCWILYAQNISNPNLVFEYMLANDLGQDLAIYYEEYSIHLEETGRIQKADELYRVGIERHVEPLARLRRRYKEFLLRHANSPEDAIIRPHGPQVPLRDLPSSSPTTTSQIRRVPLGIPMGDGQSVEANRAPGTTGAGLGRRPKPPSGTHTAASSSSRNNIPLTIYSDGDRSPSQRRDVPSPWVDLGTRDSRRRENA